MSWQMPVPHSAHSRHHQSSWLGLSVLAKAWSRQPPAWGRPVGPTSSKLFISRGPLPPSFLAPTPPSHAHWTFLPSAPSWALLFPMPHPTL